MYIAILLPSLLTIFALYKQKLTSNAIIIFFLFSLIISLFGGMKAIVALSITLLMDLSKKLNHKKDLYHVISNYLPSTICILCYTYTKSDIFYVMYYCTLGASLADELAGSIGIYSQKKPLNILTLKTIKPGESGGVTFLGINASIFAGIILGLICYTTDNNISSYLLIIVMSLFGSLLDSIFGASIQGKFKCSVCHKQVEEDIHCNKKAKLIKGFAYMQNNEINLLCNIIVFITSYILLF